MIPDKIKKLLIDHLVDISRLTHYENEGGYWKFFNLETMSGFELHMEGDDIYTLSVWSTTSFYIELSLKSASKIKA